MVLGFKSLTDHCTWSKTLFLSWSYVLICCNIYGSESLIDHYTWLKTWFLSWIYLLVLGFQSLTDHCTCLKLNFWAEFNFLYVEMLYGFGFRVTDRSLYLVENLIFELNLSVNVVWFWVWVADRSLYLVNKPKLCIDFHLEFG